MMKIAGFRILAAGTILIGLGALDTGVHAQGDATPVAYAPVIEPAQFTTTIDNPWYPLQPGSVWIYDGTSSDGAEHDEVTVTRDTKVIMGVTCVVVHDVVSTDGAVTEDTFDYYAQDMDGNVWYFGEDSSVLENGKVVSTEGSWTGGVNGAYPGIQMLASPQLSLQYRQEYLAGEAEDMAAIIDTHGSAEIPFGSFSPVLVTAEWTPLEPGVTENKTYGLNIGLIIDKEVQGGDEKVTLTTFTPATDATPVT